MVLRSTLIAAAFGIAVCGPATARDIVTYDKAKTIVEAPTTRVETKTGRKTSVRVNAPHAQVKIGTSARHVRIRVPYYSGDIRW
jgi:hypothetical protein